MIKSMTGYGSAQGRFDSTSYVVEIKTVNNRFLKTRVKLPEMVAFLEEEIEKMLSKNLSRGSVNYTLRFKVVSSDVLFDIDESALTRYMEKLSRISPSVNIGSLLNLPGILMPVFPEKDQAEIIRTNVLSASQEALDKLKQMRTVEGQTLAGELQNYCEELKKDLEKIKAQRQQVPLVYQKKLQTKIDALLAGVNLKLDKDMLAREVAIFAERSDILEEVTRLESHLQQFLKSCQLDGQAGRRLDFLSQEMLRETNTIASKAYDTGIAHLVVDMKCWIDRIKEQVQNIE